MRREEQARNTRAILYTAAPLIVGRCGTPRTPTGGRLAEMLLVAQVLARVRLTESHNARRVEPATVLRTLMVGGSLDARHGGGGG